MAKREAKQSLYLPRQSVNLRTFDRILSILWMILSQDGDVPKQCAEGLAITPPQLPSEQPTPSASPTIMTGAEHHKIHIALSFATANVRTFYKGDEGVPGKLHYVRAQFKHLHLHFLGLQETRTSRCSSTADGVYRLASGDHQGPQGVELWINMEQPYGWRNGKALYFKMSHFVVTYTDPRFIVVHVRNEQLDFWIAVVYAPQSGIALTERTEWWARFTEQLKAETEGHDLVLMIDANAATGATDGEHVFIQDDKATSGTCLLRELLATHRLCLPATSECHQGEQATWTCPATDIGHRIDYVALPITWQSSCTISRTIPELDFGHVGDHTAVGVEVQWRQFSAPTHRQGRRGVQFDRQAIAGQSLHLYLADYVPLDWQADIENQVHHCNAHLHQVLRKHCPKQGHRPKKQFITEEIWQLRTLKLREGRQVRHLRRLQLREVLAHTFAAWRSQQREQPSNCFYVTLRCAQLKAGVQFQIHNRELRKSLRNARGHALKEALASLPSDCSASAVLQQLKPIIGPTNLRHKRETPLPIVKDDDGSPCRTHQELVDRWVNFFGAMEGGTRMDADQLRAQWLYNLGTFIPDKLCLQPEDLPTLVDLEQAYRCVKPGKAIGADDIPPELCHAQPALLARLTFTQMLKLTAHGQESLLHKGGQLVSAWKRKGPQSDCSSYRSLLISSHIGKTIHRAVRSNQSTIYENFLQNSQVGGRKRVPVGLGVHHVRASLRRAKQRKASSALIFLDLQEALYRVIRPLAVGGALTDDLLAQIAQRLRLDEDTLHGLHELLREPAATACAGLQPHLQTALRALHTDTHFWMSGQCDYVRTAIGTRPGDPFADVVFGYMFARILKDVEEQMRSFDLLETYDGPNTSGLFSTEPADTASQQYLGPTWMDDLCITLSASTAEDIERQAGQACGILLDTCRRHGVSPNLSKGKSEILFAFRGPGSRAHRRKYFGPSQSGRMTIVTEQGVQEISVVGQYQHLGGLVHHSGETRHEMRRRAAQGHAAFSQHRKAIYQNHQLNQRKRSELFQTLVVSKVLFGMESWTLMDKVNKHYFHSAYMRLYRRLLKTPPAASFSDEEILTQIGLPSPTTLLRISRLRYLALLYKCEHVTPWAVFRTDTEWLTLIQDDLQWLWHLIQSTTQLPDPATHFGVWENVLRYHRTYWKRLLQRASQLELLHCEDQVLLLKLHRDAFRILEHKGPFAHRPQIFVRAPDQADEVFGCMYCCKRFRSHGGEGAHLCRAHGIVSQLRWLYDGTSCPACLREYHTFAKLQQHLRGAATCRALLQGQRHCREPAPGKGSAANERLHNLHDGLLPILQAQGPRDDRRQPRAEENYDLQLFEDLATLCFEHQDHPDRDLQAALTAKIQERPIGWTATRRTLQHFVDSLTCTDADLAQLDFDEWKRMLTMLGDFRAWSFLREDHQQDPTEHDLSLDQYEDWCTELRAFETPRAQDSQVPRIRFQERVVVHAYSGRRRHGDFQWYMEAIAERKDIKHLFVVSLDLVIDQEWGDIGRQESYEFWTHAIYSGYVIGMIGGPPCCTWSAARGKTDASMAQLGRTGPRPIRSAAELWGFWSLSIREKRQILDGHRLLAFSLICMMLLEQVDGSGVLEHPSEPADPLSPSIWKLPLMILLLQLPGFDKVVFAQGLLGADSAKSTTLLTLNLPTLPKHIRAHAISAEVPKTRSIGLDQSGHFRTAVLKEYPPALCSAIAASFADFLGTVPDSGHHIPTHVLHRIQAMVCTDFGTTIGRDCVKG